MEKPEKAAVSEAEAESAFNETLKRMLKTPPKPHEKGPQQKGSGDRAGKNDDEA